MKRRLFLLLCLIIISLMPLSAVKTACLNSSLADLWKLAGGSVDITVEESVERGFASSEAILVDSASGRNINTELLVAAEPDLVIGSADTASHVRLSSFLDKAGIDMILVDMDSFDDFLSVFHTLTDITGRSDLYEKYGEGQKVAIEEIIANAAGYESKPRVLFVRAGSAFSYVKAKRADDHFAAKIIEDLGAVNIADEYGMLTDSLSLEAVLESNADKILVVPQGDEDASIAYITDLFSQPGWRDVMAIENGSVYFLPKKLFHFKPNGRWVEAYEMMEEVLYE